jgi:hypothetical protein
MLNLCFVDFYYFSFILTALNQISSFTGEAYENVHVNFTLNGSVSAWSVDFSAQLNFSRLSFVFDYFTGTFSEYISCIVY